MGKGEEGLEKKEIWKEGRGERERRRRRGWGGKRSRKERGGEPVSNKKEIAL